VIIIFGTWLIMAATVGVAAGVVAVMLIGPRDRGRVAASAIVAGLAVSVAFAGGFSSIAAVAVVALVAALVTAAVSRYVSLSEPSSAEGTIAEQPADAEPTLSALRQRIRRERSDP
jgi:hypothetical protein